MRRQEAAQSDLVTFVQGLRGEENRTPGPRATSPLTAQVEPPCLGAQPSLFPLSSSSFLSEPLVGLSVSEQGIKDSNRVWFGSAAQIVPECWVPSDRESRGFNPQAVAPSEHQVTWSFRSQLVSVKVTRLWGKRSARISLWRGDCPAGACD